MLKIYADENIERAIIDGLKRRNIDITSPSDADRLGLSDLQQLEYAVEIKAALFTYDSDFIDISHQWQKGGKSHYGIFYIHPLYTTIGDCIRRLKDYAELFEPEDIKNQFIFL